MTFLDMMGAFSKVEMSSEEFENLDRQLRESSLKLEFAKNFLREVQNDGLTGLDHDAALSTAVCAVADAEAEYARAHELFTKAMEQIAERGRPSAAD